MCMFLLILNYSNDWLVVSDNVYLCTNNTSYVSYQATDNHFVTMRNKSTVKILVVGQMCSFFP